MGQLAGRLKELARLHTGGDAAWQDRIDHVGHLEQTDQAAAHAAFIALKTDLVRLHFTTAAERLKALTWLTDLPDLDASWRTLRELERGIRDFERALGQATSISNARAATAAALDGLKHRQAARADPAAEVAFDALDDAAAAAEATRRAAQREATAEARYTDAVRRAKKTRPVAVAVPDLSTAVEPDVEAVHARLDQIETELSRAERVNDLHAQVRRSVRDAATRDYVSERRRALLKEADAAVKTEDRDAAATALQDILARGDTLRQEAAKLASAGARARKRGARGPDKERKRGDLQDYYG